jgi:hypothetical protein
VGLHRIGCSVQKLDDGDGVPDLLVGLGGVNYLLEVKSGNGRLTEDQETWHDSWGGQVAIVRSLDDALKVLNLVP